MGANVAIEMAAGSRFTGNLVLVSPSFSARDEPGILRVMNRLTPALGYLPWRAGMLKIVGSVVRSTKLPPESCSARPGGRAEEQRRALLRRLVPALHRVRRPVRLGRRPALRVGSESLGRVRRARRRRAHRAGASRARGVPAHHPGNDPRSGPHDADGDAPAASPRSSWRRHQRACRQPRPPRAQRRRLTCS